MAALGWTEADIAKLETRAIVAERENERLRAVLEKIIRECGALNKGPVAVNIAHRALENR